MLKICKGGILKDDTTRIPHSLELRYLLEPCEISRGVTLRDILCLMDNNIATLNFIIGNWCDEIVREGLGSDERSEEQGYLELYWRLERTVFQDESDIKGVLFPALQKIKGREQCSLYTTAVKDLVDLPIILSPGVEMYEDDMNTSEFYLSTEADYYPTTLLQIYQGIIMELSFLRSPTDKDEFKVELDTRLALW